MSQQLQQEIADHRRMLRDNQERVSKNDMDYKELKRKVKKREHKIDKLRA